MKTHAFWFSGILFFVALTSPVWAQENLQKHSLGFKAYTTLSPSLVVDRNYPIQFGSYAINSDASLGFEGQLIYYRTLSPNFKLGIGILGGVHSYNLSLYLSEGFVDLGKQEPHVLDFTEYLMNYWGMCLEARLTIPLKRKSALSFKAGISPVFFIPWYHMTSAGVILKDNQRKEIFHAEIQVNEEQRNRYPVNLGMDYVYKLTPNIHLNAGVVLNYSNAIIMETDQPYEIIGDATTLTGNFKKQLLNFGAGIGVSYNFINQKS